MPSIPKNWTPDDSAELYGIRRWGNGYFDVDPDGALTVRVPFDGGDVRVALPAILDGLRRRGLRLPLLLRIENLLDAQIARLNKAFHQAIRERGYGGSYQGVFPIKVNQQRQVIEEITRFGTPWRHGLEAGSKAELAIAMASLPADGRLIVCNGYKDRTFIELGLEARRLGHNCVFVLETPGELDLILDCSDRLGVTPVLGIRAKLSTRVDGHWNLTSGERSIFGLSISQIVGVVDRLKQAGRLETLRLLHCHLGSQIPVLDQIGQAAQEACRFYRELRQEGAPMGMIDFGGGLAVDYLGDRSQNSQSRDYSLRQYADRLVATVQRQLADDDPPLIITESGRPTVAYYSLLLFDIFDVTRFEAEPDQLRPAADDPDELRRMHDLLAALDGEDPATAYRQIVELRDRLHQAFTRGELSLRRRARVQNLLLAAGHRLVARFGGMDRRPKELDRLRDELADICYGNLSVFQSLPDHWAIGQLFPVAPIHRLDERPDREAIIADITCDSDGRISHFIGDGATRSTLPVHALKTGEDYVLGVFLVGAYQETLGDLHNLFGDTDVASVRIDPDGGFQVTREDRGDRVEDILQLMQYRVEDLRDRLRRQAEQAVGEGRISLTDRQAILARFDRCLQETTYFCS
ncbi:arginine decarboxylase [Geothermobacter ehrlichii]|uniref:Arginine decarboxylase n=1 Tax=Geothermobacter ehrlichii TaxID=213224 RepID=A0A5D3WJE3_9BACT|nr:biosynthetic arginine decarboxylase [Geothermobacter ehrlichii]TYO99046.1 arginine decarboxylase [Geothermobacter ehrlichii]